MISSLLCIALLVLQSAQSDPPKSAASDATKASAEAGTNSGAAASLLGVKRIFVEDLGNDIVSKQVQAMLVTSLSESKRFIVTENRDKADAFLKGSALEKSSQEFHSYSEGTAVRRAAINDSSTSTETISDAHVAVRLVNKDGDVIWTSTQESRGAKYKGPTADVADKIIKQLMHDVEKLEKGKGSGVGEKATR